jgi:hypothetical protein
MLAQIHEHTMLSDNAKRVLFREREIAMLRHAIEEDISRGDYDAGMILCDEMINSFGYRQEAESFRSRILHARQEHYEAQVHTALEQFDTLLAARNWARAHEEAARIRRLYPDSHYVKELDRRIQEARDGHKSELELKLMEAAQREDMREAMTLLRELDKYLSRDEAGRLTEVAQSVVSKHRKGLEQQFKAAVNDRQWAKAAQIGQTIVSEFPKTKMADEVRSMIQVLRTRATQAAVSSEGT